MSRILVTGASGLLGLNFGLQFTGRHEIIGVTNSRRLQGVPFELRQVDLAQPGSAARLMDEVRPDIVLHCAAQANIDAAEGDPVMAERINARVPGEIAAASRSTGAAMVHISTDAVFDGVRGNYLEEDVPNPVNIYAQTKLRGEQAVLAANPDAAVARVNFYGWSVIGTRSLGELFYNNLSVGKNMFGFTDVFFCTLQVNVLSEILLHMAELRLKGIYHVVSHEALSKYDFGCRVARRFGLDESLIIPVSWKDGGLKAVRSPNLTLRTEKLAAALGSPLPDQASGLERFYQLYREGLREKIRQFAI
jgi:dTDP-4-dehydrorhamnose reductase